MSYNGSGTFVINTAGQPVVSGTVISSTAFNALTADLATGLSTAITKDGQTTPTANIPMGNNKITGLAVGTAATDAANLSQVQSTAAKLVNSVSGVDTITGTMSPTLAAYAAGQMFYFVAAGDNTGAVTLNLDGLGAKSVTRDGSVALAAGDIKSGEVVVVVYDGTRFQVVSQLNSAGNATFANVSITSALNVGGVATFSAGTAAAPSITTSGDTNNGIFFPATDVTAITTAGSERLRVDASGNLGLGVTPSAWFSTFRAFQFGANGSSVFGRSENNTAAIASNAFVNSSGNFTYINTNTASYYQQLNGQHQFYTAPSGTAGNAITFTQAMTLDASGRLMLGTTVADTIPTAGMTIGGAASGTDNTTPYNNSFFNIKNTDRTTNNLTVMYFDGLNSGGSIRGLGAIGMKTTSWTDGAINSDMVFWTSGSGTVTERARITSGGDLLVGTTTSKVTQFNANATGVTISGAAFPVLALWDTADSSYNLMLAQDGGTGYVTNYANGPLVLGTNNNERARITSDGNLLVGTTDVNSQSGIGLKIAYDSAAPYFSTVGSSTSASNYSYLLYSTGASAFRFYVSYSGVVSATNTTISAISDQRYKENIRDLDIGLNAIMALKPRKFDWKHGKGKDIKDDRGFIAQEFEQVFPDLVDEWADPAPEGEEPYKAVRQDLIPVLVKAMQEQQAMIEQLKAEVAALKGA